MKCRCALHLSYRGGGGSGEYGGRQGSGSICMFASQAGGGPVRWQEVAPAHSGTCLQLTPGASNSCATSCYTTSQPCDRANKQASQQACEQANKRASQQASKQACKQTSKHSQALSASGLSLPGVKSFSFAVLPHSLTWCRVPSGWRAWCPGEEEAQVS
jgi:hypothetical protein